MADVNRVARKYLDLDHAITGVMLPRGSGAAGSRARRLRRPGIDLPRRGASHRAAALGAEGAAAPGGAAVHAAPDRQHAAERSHPDRADRGCQRHGERVRPHPQSPRDCRSPPARKASRRCSIACSPTAANASTASPSSRQLDAIGAREKAGTDFSVAGAERALRARRGAAGRQRAASGPAGGGAARSSAARWRSVSPRATRAPDSSRSARCAPRCIRRTDPSLRMSTPESVRALTPAAVRGYYQRVFRPDLTTIVVIGKVTPAGRARDHREVLRRLVAPQGPTPDDRPAGGAGQRGWPRSPCPMRAACRTAWCWRRPSRSRAPIRTTTRCSSATPCSAAASTRRG